MKQKKLYPANLQVVRTTPTIRVGSLQLIEAVTKAILAADSGDADDWRDNTDLGEAAIHAYRKHPCGEYVRLDDHMDAIIELQAEKAGLEQIAMAQTVTITEARAEAARLWEALLYLRDCIESGQEPGMGIVHKALRQQEQS
jgi:hypothetical protein